MKKFLPVVLWVLAPFAVLFIGIIIYGLFHSDEVYLNADVGKSSTSLYVTNTSKIEWVKCVVTLNNDKFQSPTFNVRAGERYQLLFSDFTAEDGMRFSVIRFAPKRAKIECGPRGERRYDEFRWTE